MKESLEEVVRFIVEDFFFNIRFCIFLMNFNIFFIFLIVENDVRLL